MKKCKKCEQIYEGLKCKPCAAKYMREWNAKNPEKVKKSKKEKYLRHKEKIDAKNKKWAETNREKSNEIKKAHKDRNREKYLLQQKEYRRKRYLEKRDLILSQRKTPEALMTIKKWREKNKKRLNTESLQNYHSTNDKSKFKARNTVSIALKSGRLKKADQCQICGSEEKIQAHHPDYTKPLTVIWLCIPCHKKIHSKYFNEGDKTLE